MLSAAPSQELSFPLPARKPLSVILLHPPYIFNTFLYNFYVPFTKAFLKLYNQLFSCVHGLARREALHGFLRRRVQDHPVLPVAVGKEGQKLCLPSDALLLIRKLDPQLPPARLKGNDPVADQLGGPVVPASTWPLTKTLASSESSSVFFS